MRTPRPALVLFLCALIAASLSAQQSPSTSTSSGPQTPQTASIIQQSIAAMTGAAAVTDVTITGTITVTKSGDFAVSTSAAGHAVSEAGTITLIATASGQGQSTTATALGTSVIVQDISQSTPTLTVGGQGGSPQTIQTASALTPHPGWFYPALVLSSGLSSPYYAASYIGQETWQGTPVEHVAIWRTSASGASAAFQQASEHDVYLDSSSLLPVAMTYIAHPYNPNSPSTPFIPYRGNSPDRLITIQFSDYQQVQGRQVPLHIQSAMTVIPLDATSDFVSDIQISSASFNTGVAIASN
jgi:hypothetical protein